MAIQPVFEGIPPSERGQIIAFFTHREFGPNERIVTAGERGNEMFWVAQGHVTVKVEGGVVAKLGPGDTFGEICLADGGVRSASVFAVDAVRLLVIDLPRLRLLVERHPRSGARILENVLCRLGDKLRRTDDLLGKLMVDERQRDLAKSKGLWAAYRRLVGGAKARGGA
jgi:CRP-like cAMP-binding protein